MARSTDFDVWCLIVPLADLVVRWSMYSQASRDGVREWIKTAGFDKEEEAAIIEFLSALEKSQDENDD